MDIELEKKWELTQVCTILYYCYIEIEVWRARTFWIAFIPLGLVLYIIIKFVFLYSVSFIYFFLNEWFACIEKCCYYLRREVFVFISTMVLLFVIVLVIGYVSLLNIITFKIQNIHLCKQTSLNVIHVWIEYEMFIIVNMNNYYREAKLLFASHSFSQAAKTIEKVKHFETNLSFLFLWGYSMYMVCLSFDRLI